MEKVVAVPSMSIAPPWWWSFLFFSDGFGLDGEERGSVEKFRREIKKESVLAALG